jgi:hypothetical protein
MDRVLGVSIFVPEKKLIIMNRTLGIEKNKYKLLFIKAFIVSLVLCALIGITVLLIGKMGEMEEKILATTCSIGITSLLGLCCSLVYPREGLRMLSFTGIGSAVLALLLMLIATWSSWHSSAFERSLGTAVVMALSLAHVCLLFLADVSKPAIKQLLVATVVCISILAMQFIVLLWFQKEIQTELELYVRLMGVFGILDALGTIVIPIWNKALKK